MGDASEDEVIEYDLTDWDENARSSLEWMLRGRDVTFEWEEPGRLVVRESDENVVDTFVDYLSAGPVELDAAAEDAVEQRAQAPGEWIPLDDFYAADPARSDSEEVDFGDQWKDEADIRYELHWVRDTGELYLLVMTEKWFGSDLYVEILGRVAGRENVERALYGWEQAMVMDNSVGWVRAQVATAEDQPDDQAEPSVQEPSVTVAPAPHASEDWWTLPAEIGWITSELDDLAGAYAEWRSSLHPDAALEAAIRDALDPSAGERLVSFFSGEMDVVYGEGAGEETRVELRDALEAKVLPSE